MTNLDAQSPFRLDNVDAYQQWRDDKYQNYPTHSDALFVEIKDPFQISDAEKQAITQCIQRTNMVIYQTNCNAEENPAIPAAILNQMTGGFQADHNPNADENGVTALTVNDGPYKHYIPYREVPINWHTDGYYNTLDRQVCAMVLHCVRPAFKGGSNALMDQEMLYILLREQNPDYIAALMKPDAMRIPARVGKDGKIKRPESCGPVFSVGTKGYLHMRYTARKRNIRWSEAVEVQEAKSAMESILESESPYIHTLRLKSGWGMLCNNVPHNRDAIKNDETVGKRLFYRIRCYNRL
ncbi:MAG: TauD/TfdA family dioxygenase [Magnetococcales bacterium]|nr:TauD/TfdA family dioxygenase [Magnetococcales bacterium]